MSCLKRLERVGYFAAQHAGGACLWLHLLSPVRGDGGRATFRIFRAAFHRPLVTGALPVRRRAVTGLSAA